MLRLLDGPVGRVSGLDVPAPYNGTLEAATIPDSDKIIDAVRRLYAIKDIDKILTIYF